MSYKDTLFNTIYYSLISATHTIAMPFLMTLSFKHRYRESIPARFFLWKDSPQKVKNGIHFHGCSLGEINSLKPFIKEFQRIGQITVTASTNTGFESAKKIKDIEVKYLPFETFIPFWLKKQKLLVVAEAELWFLLFYVAKKRGAKTVLLSGRISERSFPKYKKMGWFYKKLFQNIDLFLVQTEKDRERFIELGAKNIEVTGNIKLLKPTIHKSSLTIPTDREIVIGASTHKGEEEIILDGFRKYGKGRLIIVPRHPERFNEVDKLIKEFCKSNSISYNRYSENNSFKSDVTLFDVMGRLIELYSLSDTVILGGSFIDGIGGHNPVEPASFKNRVISGEFYLNQIELYSYISNIEIVNSDTLLTALESEWRLSSFNNSVDFDRVIELIKS